MIYFNLFLEFFKIGFMSYGGGYATLPFLYNISQVYHWYSAEQLSQMIAISSITPGPVGVNVATFAGFSTSGILGALIATFSLILPSFFIVIGVSKLLKKFCENFFVQAIIYALKPAGCGLLTAVGVELFKHNIVDSRSFLLLVFLFILTFKYKRQAFLYLSIGGLCGILSVFI